MSIRARLTLWIVFAMALTLAALGATLYHRARADLLRTVDRDLHERSERIARFGMRDREGRARPSWDRGRPPWGGSEGKSPPPPRMRGEGRPPGPPRGEPRPPGPGWRFAPRLIAPDGAVMFPPPEGANPWDGAAFTKAMKGKPLYTTIMVDDEPVRVLSQPVIEQGNVARVLQVAHPLTDTYQALRGLTRTLLTLIPVALLVSAGGGAFLIDRVLRPVRQLTSTARGLSAEDLAQRLPVGGKDEFSELAATFNAMLGRLQSAFARLQEIVEQQRRFTGDASHELRTPLAIVKANTTLTLTGERTAEDYRAALKVIDGAVDRMTGIVQDLLLLARSDGGQLGQNVKTTPVSEVLARAVEALPPDQAPVFAQIAEGATVVGNEDELTRLFANLLENAARHTPPEGRISVSARADNGELLVTIADTGEGIPAEHLPYVCERFYRVESSRTRNGSGGTGLGLAICQSIVEAHHGALDISSEEGTGTTVAVRLPHGSQAGGENSGLPAQSVIGDMELNLHEGNSDVCGQGKR